jgi:hypothetical protein
VESTTSPASEKFVTPLNGWIDKTVPDEALLYSPIVMSSPVLLAPMRLSPLFQKPSWSRGQPVVALMYIPVVDGHHTFALCLLKRSGDGGVRGIVEARDMTARSLERRGALPQTLVHRRQQVRRTITRRVPEKSDHRHRWLLRAPRPTTPWPRRREARWDRASQQKRQLMSALGRYCCKSRQAGSVK